MLQSSKHEGVKWFYVIHNSEIMLPSSKSVVCGILTLYCVANGTLSLTFLQKASKCGHSQALCKEN
jgi:hypothetical protein